NQCATIPDSKPPNSFEVPMNKLFTAETRPRFSSGVSNCTKVWRTTTLILSTAPQAKSIRKENQNHLEKPNAIVANPNTATAHNKACPAFCNGGRCARIKAQRSDPIGSAACRKPNPVGPVCKISFAYTGNRV